jgi:hypothetical protein
MGDAADDLEWWEMSHLEDEEAQFEYDNEEYPDDNEFNL